MERRKLLLGSRGCGEGSRVSLRNKIYDGEGGKGGERRWALPIIRWSWKKQSEV